MNILEHSLRKAARLAFLILAVTLFVFGATPAASQQLSDGEDDPVLEEITVLGTRTPQEVADFPGSLTIVGLQAIEDQKALGFDLGSILAMEVPGLATASGGVSSYEMTLRGRASSVLIDGVPITAVLRPAGRDLMSLDASAIQEIEVIRGSSALYGNGGAGGVINYITRSAAGEGTSFSTDLSVGMSLTHFGDSLRPRGVQTIEGRKDSFSYFISASYEVVNSFFDADGDRIPPSQSYNGGLPDSDVQNYFLKAGYEWDDQMVEASFLYYDQAQDTDYGPVAGNLNTLQKTTAALGAIDPRSSPEGTKNTVANLVYSNADIWGSSFRVQAYYQQTDQVFAFLATRFGGSQSYVDSEKTGARIDINTDFEFGSDIQGYVRWGVDYTDDTTLQPLIDGRIFVPPLTMESLAGFAQLNVDVTSWLNLQGGVRYEDMDVLVKDFVSLSTGVAINGGTLTYDASPANAGAIFHLTDSLDLYTAWSQGYSVSDIGVVLRTSSNPDVVTELAPEAVEYDNYEIGLRYSSDLFTAELVAYRSKSDLGSNFVPDPDNPGSLMVQRRPEEIEGYEFAIQAFPAEDWRLGGTVSYLKGRVDNNQDGDFDDPYEYLDNTRIPPLKITAFVEHDFSEAWKLRLQMLYSGERDKFDTNRTTYGLGPPEEFTTFDLLSSWEIGPGLLTAGISNLFNEDYFGNYALAQNNSLRLAKKPGATATLGYRWIY